MIQAANVSTPPRNGHFYSLLQALNGLAMLPILLCTAALAQAPASSPAQAQTPMELFIRFERFYVTYTLNADGTHVEERESAIKVLKQQAVEYAKYATISYSTSVQKADVIAAYTQKADGRRIDVPKDNYQLQVNSGKDKAAASFSDFTSLKVIFPEVAVGDTLVLSYKLTTTEAIFPGHFSTVEGVNPTQAYDDARFRISAPSSLWTQYSARNLVERVNTEKDGRKILEWTYENKQPMRPKRKDWSVVDPDDMTGFSFSTFRNYAEISQAYGLRAKPKAAVTTRVQALAEEITKDKNEPREQARLMYEWVARNINYAGNCVGIGAVVPRDLDFVLDNKIGDCKDHTTLLEALLTAKGIKSTQALINSGSVYRLAKVPVVSMVNHVINYLPELNQFVDSTSDSTPFDMLPVGDADKPILLVDGFKDGFRTPPTRSDNNRQRSKSILTIAADGSISGTVDLQFSGLFAVAARANDRDVTTETEAEMMKSYFDRDHSGFGFGRIEREDPKPLTDRYAYKFSFKAKEFLNLPGAGAGATYIGPVWPGVAPIQSLLSSGVPEEEAKEQMCMGGISEEEYLITFPKTMKILSVPKNVNLKNELVSYTASYSLKGNQLKVKRSLVDKTRGNVCPISVQNNFAALSKKAIQDLKGQIVYK